MRKKIFSLHNYSIYAQYTCIFCALYIALEFTLPIFLLKAPLSTIDLIFTIINIVIFIQCSIAFQENRIKYDYARNEIVFLDIVIFFIPFIFSLINSLLHKNFNIINIILLSFAAFLGTLYFILLLLEKKKTKKIYYILMSLLSGLICAYSIFSIIFMFIYSFTNIDLNSLTPQLITGMCLGCLKYLIHFFVGILLFYYPMVVIKNR